MKTLKKCLSLLLTLLMVLPCATGVIGSAVAYAAALEDTNVALGKSVMVSAGSGESAVTDGNTDGGYWDSGDIHPADVTVDLGGYYKLSSISVYPYYGAPTRYYHYTIEVSPDGISYEQVAAKTTNETETAAGSTYDIGTLDKTARFVRVTMLENSANPSLHLHEIKVMGHEDKDYEPGHDVPVVEDPNDANNIAFSKPTRANSNSGFSRLVVNGNTTDSWSGVGFPRYVDIDLMKNYDVSDVTVFTPPPAPISTSFTPALTA